MKKMIIVLMVATVSSKNLAFEDLQSTPIQYGQEEHTTFLDVSSMPVDEYSPVDLYLPVDEYSDEYVYEENGLRDIEEYDQNVTDTVTSPKISGAQAMATEICGALLVHYINLREKAREYFKDVKDVLVKWYHTII